MDAVWFGAKLAVGAFLAVVALGVAVVVLGVLFEILRAVPETVRDVVSALRLPPEEVGSAAAAATRRSSKGREPPSEHYWCLRCDAAVRYSYHETRACPACGHTEAPPGL